MEYSGSVNRSYMVLQEYWDLVESIILPKPVLGGVRIVALNKTESVVFLYCRFFLFLKDLFLSLFRN